MTIVVSRATIHTSAGEKLCSSCGRRPPRGPGQSWCRECHAAYMRRWRAGKVEVLLTPDEWAAVKEARAAVARGRHHRLEQS